MDGSNQELARRTAVISAVVAVLVVAIVHASELLLALFAGVLLAVLLRGIARAVSSRTRISPGLALVAVVFVLLGTIVLAVWLTAPSVVEQFRELVRTLPESVAAAKATLSRVPWGTQIAEQAEGAARGNGAALAERASELIAAPLRIFVDLVIILVVGLYMAASPTPYIEGALRLVPPARRDRIREVIDAVGHTLRIFLVGRLASMVGVGVLTGIGLHLIGVPLAAALAILAGALTFVPYAGPLAAAVPIALVALVSGTQAFVLTLVMYTAVQSIEGFLLTPLVQERAVKLLPAVTLAAEVLLGWFFGPIGVIVSVPLAAAALVVIERLYIEDILGDRKALHDAVRAEP